MSEWSDVVKRNTAKAPEFSECIWKQCPKYVDKELRYSVDENNPRIALNGDGYFCTVIGNTLLPLNKITSRNIKILKSKYNNGNGIEIGVAPFDTNQNYNYNYVECGWYFDCYESTLCSGPPHNYGYPGKEYGSRKEKGKYVLTGDNIGLMMDTAKGELSFDVNGASLGVAYEGIPLDKPLVPCVALCHKGDSVELINLT